MAPDSPTGRPRDSLRYRVVVATALAVAVAIFVVAGFLVQTDEGEDSITRSGGSSEFVERLIPGRDDSVLRQAQVGVDLAAGWDGTLVIGGTALPDDEIVHRTDLNLVLYTPAEGKTIEQFEAGTNCVLAIVWRVADGPGVGNRNVRWCFEVT